MCATSCWKPTGAVVVSTGTRVVDLDDLRAVVAVAGGVDHRRVKGVRARAGDRRGVGDGVQDGRAVDAPLAVQRRAAVVARLAIGTVTGPVRQAVDVVVLLTGIVLSMLDRVVDPGVYGPAGGLGGAVGEGATCRRR